MGDREKSQECIQWLTAHADALKSSYPSAYEPWDYEALTMETNRITLLHNPIHASNKEPWMWETVCHLMGTGKEITVYTPYIICGKEMYADLTALCKKTDRRPCLRISGRTLQPFQGRPHRRPHEHRRLL